VLLRPRSRRLRPEHLRVDHFLPRARFHADGVANLVLARASHSASKSDLFAASRHVQAWAETVGDRVAVARQLGLDHEASRPQALARAGYGHLPDGSPLWLRRLAGGPGREVERLIPDRRTEIAQLLGGVSELELAPGGPCIPTRGRCRPSAGRRPALSARGGRGASIRKPACPSPSLLKE